MKIPVGIGPHNGIELKLMISGEKPLAVFTAEPGMSPEYIGDLEFIPYVESGEIIKFSDCDKESGVEWRLYCLPSEEWRAKLSLMILKSCRDGDVRKIFTVSDLHRLEGTLLGYSKESIEMFVAYATDPE